MHIDEKPSLDEALLVHYGIPGMKWGRRKARASGGSGGSKKPAKKKWSTGKKVAVGVGVLAGAAAVATLSTSAGRTRVGELAGRLYSGRKQQQLQAKQGGLLEQFGLGSGKMGTPLRDVPSPRSMMAEAQRAGVRNKVDRVGNQYLAEKTWRDSARLNRATKIPSVSDLITQQRQRSGQIGNVTRGMDTQAANLLGASQSKLQSALNNPNHIWQL